MTEQEAKKTQLPILGNENIKGSSVINNGLMFVYRASHEGLLISSGYEQVFSGFGLSANSYLDAPTIKPKKGFAIVRDIVKNKWIQKPDHRGKTAYQKSTGQSITINSVGELPDDLTLQKPNPYETWQNNGWSMTPENAALQAKEEQSQAIAKLERDLLRLEAQVLLARNKASRAALQEEYAQIQSLLETQQQKTPTS